MYSKNRLGKMCKELGKRFDYALSATGQNARTKEEVVAQACAKYRLQPIPYSATTLLLAEPGNRHAIRCETIEGTPARVSLSIVTSDTPWLSQ